MQNLIPVDHSALKTNQAVIITLLVLAFILNLPVLVGGVMLFMLVGSAAGKAGFGWLYKSFLRPAGWVKPDILQDNPEPHHFAQGFGGIVLMISVASLLTGLPGLGWGLSWLVAALAALNLFGGFCVGCAMYYWLSKLHIPGFVKTPPTGIFPGRRPRKEVL